MNMQQMEQLATQIEIYLNRQFSTPEEFGRDRHLDAAYRMIAAVALSANPIGLERELDTYLRARFSKNELAESECSVEAGWIIRKVREQQANANAVGVRKLSWGVQ